MQDKDMLIKRLNRIEGQVKGIQKMVDEERYCMCHYGNGSGGRSKAFWGLDPDIKYCINPHGD